MNSIKRGVQSFFKSSRKGDHISFDEKYELKEGLREEPFVVKSAINRETGDMVEVKIIEKASLSRDDIKGILLECDRLRGLSNPHIAQFIEVMEDAKQIYIVTELAASGELLERITEKSSYSEENAAEVIRTIAEILKYCNNHGVIHRDIKPANILLANSGDYGSIKLTGFSFAKEVSPPFKFICGTHSFRAPEILSGKENGKEVDMWSLGVVMFVLLSGDHPFFDDDQAKIPKKIQKAKFAFCPDSWQNVSNEGKDLIRRLLVVDPSKRFTVEQVLEHPWLTERRDGEASDMTQVLDKLQNFRARRRFKYSVRAIIAANTLQKATSRERSSSDSSDEEEDSS